MHSSAGAYGADRQLALLATGLDPARYRPLVVLPEPGPLSGLLEDAGVETHVRPLAVLRRELLSARGLSGLMRAWAADARSLARLAAERRAALIHSNTSVILGGAPASAARRIPHVWHVREIYTERLWPLHRRLLASATALPCVSQATATALDLPDARVLLDGVAVPPRPNDRHQLRARARRELGLAEEELAVLLAARLSPWKGQDMLVRALAAPALEGVAAVALLAGEAWRDAAAPRAAIERLAHELRVADRVRLLGFREDADALYAAADVVAVPSTRPDPLPNAALEAAAAGCCVVASATGGLPEILRDGQTGQLVRPNDPDALANAIAELARDPQRREQLGRAAAQDVRERFAVPRLLDEIQALYDEVSAPRPART